MVFFDSPLVPSALEWSLKPHLGNRLNHTVGNEPCRHHEHIGIVVSLYESADFRSPGKSGADSLMLVQGDGHTVAGTAHCDSAVHFAFFHSIGERMSDIRIVNALW